jgi:Cu-processing system ATP-binding protein
MNAADAIGAVGFADVGVRFGAVRALDAVSLEALAGEALLLAGPNGAGKSTLIAVLLGLVRPDEGALTIAGRPTAADVAFRARVGYMPESVAFAGNASGRDVLRFFASARGVDRRRVDRTLEEVGLAADARRAVRGYSRGMRQRLGLGVAILHEPDVLVLDEPTGGLDQEGLALLWRLIARWRQAGRVVILASHELGLVERRVDRVAILRRGRLIAHATAEALRARAALPVRLSWAPTAAGIDGQGHAELAELADRLAAFGQVASAPAGATSYANGASGDERVVVDVRPDALAPALVAAAAWSEGRGGGGLMRVEEPGLDVVYEALLGEAAKEAA